ncbi:TPA: hypothetical protein HA239_04050 [Candidatus Woesearchaeota archaeon]|nr:hypothetical protein QT06_C0001G0773 [archaeon GW2011_AR15]MBS3103447.1 hypothetical protein [Candidatus Woesearchaeota archaeon]HIH41565.1 hypothetical protein [Candidatus Woesearchaeota archaeon]
MKKKAQTYTILNWALYRMPVIIFVAIFFAIALRSYYGTGLDSHDVENMVMIKRIIYSDNILAYRDPVTGRTFPGIVDINKFSTEHIEENLLNNNNRIAVYMELQFLDTGEIEKAYINEERARAWDDYEFVGGFDSSSLVRYVRIYDNGRLRDGRLGIKLLVRE